MKCRCGRDLGRSDLDGLYYHEADLFWVTEPDCLDNPGEQAALPGAAPADVAGCRLMPLDQALAANRARRRAA